MKPYRRYPGKLHHETLVISIIGVLLVLGIVATLAAR